MGVFFRKSISLETVVAGGRSEPERNHFSIRPLRLFEL